MPTFTWNPTAPAQFVDWNTPGDWMPMTVPNAADADVVIPEITDASGAPYDFFVTVASAESYVVHTLTLVEQTLIVDGTLAIGAGLLMGQGSEVNMVGSLALGGLSNASAIDIQGSGEISSTASIDNQGDIVGSGLTLDVAELRNDGTLVATGSLEVDVGPETGAFNNLSDGTLSGGTYEAIDGGVLSLNIGGSITTDAATIVFGSQFGGSTGSTPIIETTGSLGASPAPLTQTLQTITATGTLSLLNATYAGVVALSDAGRIGLSNGTLAVPSLTIAATGTVLGSGTISGSLTNDGVLGSQQTTGDPGAVTHAALALDGSVNGTGTLAILSPGTVNVTSNTLELGGAATNAVAFADWNGVLVLDSPTLFAGSIRGFTIGTDTVEIMGRAIHQQSDTIVLTGLSASAITNLDYSGNSDSGTLSFRAGGTSIALGFVGDYSRSDFVLGPGPQALSTSPPSIQITESIPCFAAGTRLLTDRGEVAVEDLSVGDRLRTLLGGEFAPIRWIGRRRVDAARHPRPERLWPIRVRADAFGLGRPRQDLLISPDHAIYADGVLIPARLLVNGVTVVEARLPAITYFHVELPRHDIVLAEGLPSESYLDLGNRGAFTHGGMIEPDPDLGRRIWEREGCAELILGGPMLVRARARLAVQAALLGHGSAHAPPDAGPNCLQAAEVLG